MTIGPLPLPPIFPPLFNPAFLVGLKDLELLIIEAQVASVYKTLDEQIEAIKGLKFTGDGAIPAGSFGQGIESTRLANEHTRAHGVIVDSLVEMREDLGVFQSAILAAKGVITEADEQAEADLRLALNRTVGLDLGTDSDEDGEL
ncbi:hypothetical protein KVF89_06590 [Nocardioides carbamazepini]|jgi:hypothetical protein|uniref:hypothetical protein n=1 Tax=Nocardioides carbamazepini TaxID=2854259 RepID=UPI002149F33F|nr:hypothetical protein [Nocardioides carbamazepini]MCR1782194.1 hypothetical protein [Nocardioides carbamazepini]